MLTLRNVNITFYPGTVNERRALQDVNLQLEAGDFVTVIGSNGAGKSTMLNAISGAYAVDSGRILLGDEDITYQKEYKRAAKIGRLFQDPMKGTAPSMTIEENLGLAYLRGKKRGIASGIRKSDEQSFRELLASLDLGLEERLKTPVQLLSGGQRQALTLLMATIVTPELLLLDEHTAALDPKTARQVMKLTEGIVAKNRITTLMITHNIKDALSYGNKTIVMSQGRIVLELSGSEREAMTIEELMKLYSTTAHDSFTDKMVL